MLDFQHKWYYIFKRCYIKEEKNAKINKMNCLLCILFGHKIESKLMLQLEEVLSFEPRWRHISAIVVLLTAASHLQLEKQQELFLQLEAVLAS